jgi:hypothetical protein
MMDASRRSVLALTGSIPRIVLVAVLATAATAQTKPSAQRKALASAKPANAAAEVTYTDGQLSVVANNNSLAETLAEIRDLTKAKIEGVLPGAGERISGEFGPDTPRAVVGAVLANSHYNFILVSPPGNPAALQRIVLSEPATEPVVAVQPIAQPVIQAAPPQPSVQMVAPGESPKLEKPSADIPAPVDRPVENSAKAEPQKTDSGATEKGSADGTTGTEPSKEAAPESETAAGSSEPRRANNDNPPSVPATVVICGVTYDASQLADLKVPDHCSKPTQQPNPTSGSK